jgi:thermostable 8-oxoguanine DNA glycosylase
MEEYKIYKKWYRIYESKRPSIFDKAILIIGKDIRKRKRILKKEFIEIMSYKLGNRNYVKYFNENSQKDLDECFTKVFFEEKFDNKKTIKRVQKLTKLSMVGIATASAFLAVIFPEQYGIIDRFSLAALGLKRKQLDIDFYLEYIKIIREISYYTKINPKEVDLALMTYGFYLTNQSNKTINKLPKSYQNLEMYHD